MPVVIVLVIVSFFLFKGCKGSNTPRVPTAVDYRYLGENAIKQRLKDPESAEFSGVVVHGHVTCGYVNSKNSYGGYAGKQRFISGGASTSSFLEDDMDNITFNEVWDIKCR